MPWARLSEGKCLSKDGMNTTNDCIIGILLMLVAWLYADVYFC